MPRAILDEGVRTALVEEQVAGAFAFQQSVVARCERILIEQNVTGTGAPQRDFVALKRYFVRLFCFKQGDDEPRSER